MHVFVIPTHRRTDLVDCCLRSLKRHEPDFSRWKAVLVHDGGPREVRDWLTARYGADPQVCLILKDRNEGFSKAVNAGIALGLQMGARRLVLTNDDIEFIQPLIDAMERAFASGRQIGIVGAKLVHRDGLIQHGGFTRLGNMMGHRFHGMAGAHPPANVPGDFVVTGALMALDAGMVRQIGPLDDGYFMAFEDVDYCVTAMRADWRVLYWPDVSAIHAEGATRGRTDREKGQFLTMAERNGRYRFFAKWGASFKECVKVERRAVVAYCLRDARPEARACALLGHARALARRGWDADLWCVGPPDQAPILRLRRFPDDRALSAALEAVRGAKIAGSWRDTPIVRASLRDGDTGFLYVPWPEDTGETDPAMAAAIRSAYRAGLRPLCDDSQTARHLGVGLKLNPAVVGRGPAEPWAWTAAAPAEERLWDGVADALEDLYDDRRAPFWIQSDRRLGGGLGRPPFRVGQKRVFEAPRDAAGARPSRNLSGLGGAGGSGGLAAPPAVMRPAKHRNYGNLGAQTGPGPGRPDPAGGAQPETPAAPAAAPPPRTAPAPRSRRLGALGNPSAGPACRPSKKR
jgi:GT2 family glycosyltransferase